MIDTESMGRSTMKLALIGAGQRGMIYAEYAYFKKSAQIVAVVEPNAERRKIAA